jgi:hypothetical protein
MVPCQRLESIEPSISNVREIRGTRGLQLASWGVSWGRLLPSPGLFLASDHRSLTAWRSLLRHRTHVHASGWLRLLLPRPHLLEDLTHESSKIGTL